MSSVLLSHKSDALKFKKDLAQSLKVSSLDGKAYGINVLFNNVLNIFACVLMTYH